MSILSSIGNTPLVELQRINSHPAGVRIWVKLEGHNPGGSIKDRAALFMFRAAERSGKLSCGRTILEATSGNTGIALAMIGAAKGYRVKLILPECVSSERVRTLEAFGAEVELTPKELGTDGAIQRARQLLGDNPDLYYMPNQFANEANVRAHYETTGPEIFSQTAGEVDICVAGMGTTGTLMGLAQFFNEKKPEVKIVGVEPKKGHTIQGLKNMEESTVPEIFVPAELDFRLSVSDEEAFATCRQLAINEGIFVGMSSGAAVVGALHIARSIASGTIVAVLPDRGDRYLSTALFRSICGKCAP